MKLLHYYRLLRRLASTAVVACAVQEFHVAYIFIKMANSPRPGVFALERSKDNGETWQAWQYFADTPADCEQFFGDVGYSQTITRDDSVICSTDYSKVVPLEGGEVRVSFPHLRVHGHASSELQILNAQMARIVTGSHCKLFLFFSIK